jgi:hypothetical protein
MQWEFMYIKPGVALDDRTERWLEDADEFGILFMSIGWSLLFLICRIPLEALIGR